MLFLSDSYSSLVISLHSHSQVLDFDFVAQRCMNEEACQLSMQGVPTHNGSQNVAYLAKGSKSCHKQKDITGFKCGKKGHYCNECPVKDEVAVMNRTSLCYIYFTRLPRGHILYHHH